MDGTARHPTQRSVFMPWFVAILCLGLLAATVYFGYQFNLEQLSLAHAATEEARRATQEATERLRVQEERREEAEARVTALEEQRGALSAERDTLSAELASKESELAKLKSTFDDLETRLDAEIKKGEIRLTRSAGSLQVDLVDKILFDSGEAKLTRHGEEVLARIAGALTRVDDKRVQVSGHTDDSPISERLASTFATNWELSVARAVNVVRFLAEKGQVPGSRLMAAGYGQFKPVATNATPTGRARNRRIEILLTPDLRPGSKGPVAAPGAPAAQEKAASAPAARPSTPKSRSAKAPNPGVKTTQR